MIVSRTRAFQLALLLCLCLSGLAEASHPYHVSRAEVEFNSQTNRFQIALCVWPEDLEKALAKRAGESIDLDKSENVEALMQSYVADCFQIAAVDKVAATKPLTTEADQSNETQPSDVENAPKTIATSKEKANPVKGFRWVGHELELKQAWLYFEIDGTENSDSNSWQIENRMFFELNDDQFNQIQIGSKKDFVTEPCTPESTKVVWKSVGR